MREYATPGELRAAAEEYFCNVWGFWRADKGSPNGRVLAPEQIGKLPGSSPERVSPNGLVLALGIPKWESFLALRSRGDDWADVVDWAFSCVKYAADLNLQNPQAKNVRGQELVSSTYAGYTAKRQVDFGASVVRVAEVLATTAREMLPPALAEEFVSTVQRRIDAVLTGM